MKKIKAKHLTNILLAILIVLVAVSFYILNEQLSYVIMFK